MLHQVLKTSPQAGTQYCRFLDEAIAPDDLEHL
jgi:hypothetical protein